MHKSLDTLMGVARSDRLGNAGYSYNAVIERFCLKCYINAIGYHEASKVTIHYVVAHSYVYEDMSDALYTI